MCCDRKYLGIFLLVNQVAIALVFRQTMMLFALLYQAIV